MSSRLARALASLPPEALGPGDRLRLWREGRGLTQVALGERLGVTQPHIARIEAGEREPGADLGAQLLKLTGVRFETTEATR